MYSFQSSDFGGVDKKTLNLHSCRSLWNPFFFCLSFELQLLLLLVTHGTFGALIQTNNAATNYGLSRLKSLANPIDVLRI